MFSEFQEMYREDPTFRRIMNGIILMVAGPIFLLITLLSLNYILITIGFVVSLNLMALSNLFFLKYKKNWLAMAFILVGIFWFIIFIGAVLGNSTDGLPLPWRYLYDLFMALGFFLWGFSTIELSKNDLESVNRNRKDINKKRI
jgi:hypothetical protein